MEKKTVAVLFGGQSSEHVVSCMSAANIVEQIDTDTYNLLLIGITEEGRWLKALSLVPDCTFDGLHDSERKEACLPDSGRRKGCAGDRYACLDPGESDLFESRTCDHG